ncbi:unnamed protein product [Lactuca saligna]|uniref:Protein kinase domain-containing protein n=1 Tax=Lactuca saligna TaxID=75948 RepID=A0AA36E5M8_LACSI|nr:unnamed protein product [Lactuca saligna]
MDKSSWGRTSSESKSFRALLPSDGCHRYTFKELKFATSEFNESCVIGNEGFCKVYKGYMEKTRNNVAIKEVNKSCSQHFNEFQTEIAMLSKLRHVHLVSLIGYRDENGEMILVYEYMAQGTLQEHIYNTNNPPLS